MRVMVSAASLIARMELLPSNLKGTFPFFAIGKSAVFSCFQVSWAQRIQGKEMRGAIS